MTQYNIPFDTHFEDKILGGKLTLKQGACYLPPLILTIVLFSSNSLTTTVINGKRVVDISLVIYFILIDLILIIISTIFAFVRINGFSLLKYIYKKVSFSLQETIVKYYK